MLDVKWFGYFCLDFDLDFECDFECYFERYFEWDLDLDLDLVALRPLAADIEKQVFYFNLASKYFIFRSYIVKVLSIPLNFVLNDKLLGSE